MEIYILRHGIAEEATGGMRDADRALTDEGKKKLQSVLRRARGVDDTPAVNLPSPFRRGVEMAQSAVEIVRGSAQLEGEGLLLPAASPVAHLGSDRHTR